MAEVIQTSDFSDWLGKLRDQQAKGRIAARIVRAQAGNFGDVAPVGEGVSEMRVHVGAGYRVYFIQRGPVVIVLLCGGDKSSQPTDIARAKVLAKEWKE